ncbi:miltefosine transporter beta subunit [Trypanosoma rangeli]|uniref:Miltefosine transporter beta subunit n=1 Tax=Trypanosoma rangeli TaxID=5698 RepID=A0A3R7MGX3_TRYRA|nr:miltefosine transporter beta subunit [Trypanosoma rangeli]RNF05653.1 miltefosine transporter beta subunit [Trypanosoma rangeli]|eukprot:RNF05653.1 miltefosine transporter beta subunit [Trypanosoma rangeli]
MSDSTEQSVRKSEKKSRFERFYLGQYCQHSIYPVFATLLVLAVVFIPIGVAIIRVSDSVFELRIRYDETNNYQYVIGPHNRYPHKFTFNNSKFSTGAHVTRTFTLSKSLASPIYLQYGLAGFHQNYRRYAFSQDLAQRSGDTHSVSQACGPFRYPGEYHKRRVNGIYFPCGSVAWSMFNDSLSLYYLSDASKGDTAYSVSDRSKLICAGSAFDSEGNSLDKNNLCIKKGIALPSDVHLFHPLKDKDATSAVWRFGGDPTAEDPYQKEGYYYEEPGHPIPSIVDEDYIVWSSLSYMQDFDKKYRIITTDLLPGDYLFDIEENFDVFSFSGEKYVSLVTRSWIGGKNYVLGVLFLVMGCISFVLSLSSIIVQCLY